MTITGEQGDLRWGYHVAATLRPWSVVRSESGAWLLTATVSHADTFRVTRRPLVFATPNGWRWPVVELQIQDASLTAVLGPKERRHAEVSHCVAGPDPTAAP